jgi:cytochrome c-type protein NapC
MVKDITMKLFKGKDSLWGKLKQPSVRYSLGVLLLVGFVSGIIFWGGFNTAMEMTNTEQFCISCHEMRDNVYPEYKETIHYTNRTGVRAVCSDCHVPKEWTYKMIRKIEASQGSLGQAGWHHRHPREVRGQAPGPGSSANGRA